MPAAMGSDIVRTVMLNGLDVVYSLGKIDRAVGRKVLREMRKQGDIIQLIARTNEVEGSITNVNDALYTMEFFGLIGTGTVRDERVCMRAGC